MDPTRRAAVRQEFNRLGVLVAVAPTKREFLLALDRSV
jgi:hypothetical protein